MKAPRLPSATVLTAWILLLSTMPCGTSTAHSAVTSIPRASFIDPKSIDLSKILPPPPSENSSQKKIDTSYLKFASAAATENQRLLGFAASQDSVFDYSMTLGSWFNPKILPKTAALFAIVRTETKEAIELAKYHYKRIRPNLWRQTGDSEKSEGYCYPSGHTTRAYVWANLLSNAFPDKRKELHLQARQKAWYRVILGRHYPSDVRAGKIYGTYLAQQFLKSPEFLKAWGSACAEMRAAKAETTSPASFNP